MPRNPNFIFRIGTAAVLVLLLLLIRAFENELFYDPFLAYFKNDYLVGALPDYDGSELFFGLCFRYFLNAVISIGIVYALFEERKLVLFTAALYLVFFVLLICAFFVLIHMETQNNLLIFYVRRFLIQPLFLLLFVPAFYYQKRVAKK
jgi:exosortase F-associated protein